MLTIPWPNSLGLFYAQFTQYLGFVPNSDEWKVMGLEPYGNPGVNLGEFISLNHEAYRVNAPLLFERNNGTSAIAKRLGPERTPESEIDDSFKNIAFAVQDACEAAQMAVKVLFLDRDVRELVSPTVSCSGYHSEAREHLAYWWKQVENQDLRERLAFMDIHTHLEPRLLRDLDAMSMAHSIEVRPVLLDHRLVEFLQTVPSSIRMRQKRLLLDAVKVFLPSALLADLETRRKRTFTFPFQRWLARDLRGVMKDTFAPDRLRSMGILEPAMLNRLWHRYERSEGAVGWSRIWDLFIPQRWCELMQVSP